MSQLAVFLFGLAMSLTVSFAVVFYLSKNMRGILIDLCGTEERADFWVAFSNVSLILVPLIVAMSYVPDLSETGTSAFFELCGQFRWAMFGLLGTVLVLGYTLNQFIKDVE